MSAKLDIRVGATNAAIPHERLPQFFPLNIQRDEEGEQTRKLDKQFKMGVSALFYMESLPLRSTLQGSYWSLKKRSYWLILTRVTHSGHCI